MVFESPFYEMFFTSILTAELEVPVPVWVDPRAPGVGVGRLGLSPHPSGLDAVLISVRIDHRNNVEIEVPPEPSYFGVSAMDQLVDQI